MPTSSTRATASYKITWVNPKTCQHLDCYSPKEEWAIHLVNTLAEQGFENIQMEIQ